MNLTHIATDHNREALFSFISAAQAGRLASATREQKTAFRLACLLRELEFDLISLPESEIEGYLVLARLATGRPVWNDQKIRVSMLITAAVVPPDEYKPANLPSTTDSIPTWKRMQINNKKRASDIAQLVDEICDPELATIGGKSREDFDAQSRRR